MAGFFSKRLTAAAIAAVMALAGMASAYTITYNGNGHTSGTAPAAQTVASGQGANVAGQGTLQRTGACFFGGWSLTADAKDPIYYIGSVTSDMTLYARWMNCDNTVMAGGTVTPTVNTATPTITAQPAGASVTVGGAVSLSVTATVSDNGTLSYQWYRNTTNSTTGATAVSGATSRTYSPSTTSAGTAYYYAIVTNTNNSVNGTKTATRTSSIVSVVVSAAPTVNAATPTITAQPAGASVTVGGAVSLSVTATVSDNGTLSYQWYRNTTNSTTGATAVSGATSRTYSPSTTSAGTAYYYVVVTNTNNSVNGNKTATRTSSIVSVVVSAASTAVPDVKWYSDTKSLFEISTANELAGLAKLVNEGNDFYRKNVKLMADIDLSNYGAAYNAGKGWIPIGNRNGREFAGTFNGNNKTVSGLYINNEESDGAMFAGLFGKISEGTVLDLRVAGSVSNPYFDDDYTAGLGGLAGYLGDAYIVNCHFSGTVKGLKADHVGGLAGYVTGATLIMNSSSAGSVSASGGYYYTGGLVGFVTGHSGVSECYSSADVTGGREFTGGLTGGLGRESYIRESYATGIVASHGMNVGGLVGLVSDTSYITHSYFAGSVSSGAEHVGGLAGRLNGASYITDSYSTADVTSSSGAYYVGGLAGAVYAGSYVNSSYSTGTVKGGYYVGGLVGYLGGLKPGVDSDNPILSRVITSVALGRQVSGTANVGRVGGGSESVSSFVGNRAREDMTITTPPTVGPASKDGSNVTIGLTALDNVFPATTGTGVWSRSAWKINTADILSACGSLPYLTANAQTPAPVLPSSSCGGPILVNTAVPNITAQPAGASVTAGGTVSLSVTAIVSDGGTLSYQWYSNTTNSTTTGTAVSGATARTYSPPTASAGTKYYYVIITNTNNSVSGNKTATRTSNPAAVVVNAAPTVNAATPTITAQPAGASVSVGGAVTLSVTAIVSDNGTMSYQWYRNTTNSTTGGTVISGATSRTYSPPTTSAGTAYYYAVVTNTNNSVSGNKTATRTSSIVSVVVSTPPTVNAATPTITSQPEGARVTVGGAVSLSVTATVSDNGTLSYQWYRNTANSTTGATAVSGATSRTYSPPTATAGTVYYYAVVTNTNNSVSGTKTATRTSSIVSVAVSASGGTSGQYTITYNGNGHTSGSVPAAVKVNGGSSYGTAPQGTMQNSGACYFGGWSTTRGGEAVWHIGSVTSDMTLYARWMTCGGAVMASVVSPNVSAAMSVSEITAGPNPVAISNGSVGIFYSGAEFDAGELSIFDALGNVVGKINVRDNGNGGRSKREVGVWDLRDAKGRTVAEGTYLLRGTIKTADGKREKVSSVVSVR